MEQRIEHYNKLKQQLRLIEEELYTKPTTDKLNLSNYISNLDVNFDSLIGNLKKLSIEKKFRSVEDTILNLEDINVSERLDIVNRLENIRINYWHYF